MLKTFKYWVMSLSLLFQVSCHMDGPNSKLKNSQKQIFLEGVWQSDDYGYLLTFKEKQKRLYDFSTNHCYQQPLNSDEISKLLSHVEPIDEQTMRARIQGGMTSYHFKRIAGLPENCRHLRGSHAEALQYFTELMKAHYAYFDLYGVNWSQRVQQALDGLDTELSASKTFEVIKQLMQGIGDAHFFLNAEVDGESMLHVLGRSKTLRPALDKAFSQQQAIKDPRKFRKAWYRQYKSNIENQILKGNYHYAANDALLWGKVGEIGYINMLRMITLSRSGLLQDDLKAFKEQMDVIMTKLQDTSALIIDVTTNSGGHDEVGLMMTGYFIEKPTRVYSKKVYGSDQQEQVIEAVPGHTNYQKPVFILTSDHTVSAAETFVMAMKNLPQVTQVGEITRGAFSDVLDKTLPNGWSVGISNEVYQDLDGLSWEAKGLLPAWHFPIFAGRDIHQSHVNALGLLLKRVTSSL
ncbi:MAG: S41 family peptidase [Marinicella sp.]